MFGYSPFPSVLLLEPLCSTALFVALLAIGLAVIVIIDRFISSRT